MSRWILKTNLGYVESSIGKEGTTEVFPTFTDDMDEATYNDLEGAKRWAGDIIALTLCGVLWVKLVPLDESATPSNQQVGKQEEV